MLRSGNGSSSVIRDRMEENLASSSPKRNLWTFKSSLSLSISAAAAHVHVRIVLRFCNSSQSLVSLP